MMEYYSVIMKNEILLLAVTWMELECITLNEISELEKDKYRVILHHMGFKEQNIGRKIREDVKPIRPS